jgi:hypothetical protein
MLLQESQALIFIERNVQIRIWFREISSGPNNIATTEIQSITCNKLDLDHLDEDVV